MLEGQYGNQRNQNGPACIVDDATGGTSPKVRIAQECEGVSVQKGGFDGLDGRTEAWNTLTTFCRHNKYRTEYTPHHQSVST